MRFDLGLVRIPNYLMTRIIYASRYFKIVVTSKEISIKIRGKKLDVRGTEFVFFSCCMMYKNVQIFLLHK